MLAAFGASERHTGVHLADVDPSAVVADLATGLAGGNIRLDGFEHESAAEVEWRKPVAAGRVVLCRADWVQEEMLVQPSVGAEQELTAGSVPLMHSHAFSTQ